MKGKTLDEVVEIKNADIAKHLSLPPVKLHCSMLAEDAIKVRVSVDSRSPSCPFALVLTSLLPSSLSFLPSAGGRQGSAVQGYKGEGGGVNLYVRE